MILMLSTTVSIAGNVLITCSTGRPDFERLVALGVERVGRRHAAGHPEQDAGVGLGGGMLDRAPVVGAAAAVRPPSAWPRRRRPSRAETRGAWRRIRDATRFACAFMVAYGCACSVSQLALTATYSTELI